MKKEYNVSLIEILSLESDVTKEGYIYIYLSNENDMVNEVFFDDFKITHIESPVVQVTDYYPFGLQHANSWTRNNSVKNNRLFNAGSELNEITDNYETYYRNYDPALGRFMAVDPMASSFTSWSPYNYAYNDPVYWNDPNGDCPNCTDFLSDILHQEALDDDGRGGNNGAGYGGGLGGNSSIAENYGRGGNSFSGWAPNEATALFNLNMSSFGGTWRMVEFLIIPAIDRLSIRVIG